MKKESVVSQETYLEVGLGKKAVHSVAAGESAFFRLAATSDQKLITISVASDKGSLGFSLYVSPNCSKTVGPENYVWKSTAQDIALVRLHPTHPAYLTTNFYYISVQPLGKGKESFSLVMDAGKADMPIPLNGGTEKCRLQPDKQQNFMFRIGLPSTGKYLHVYAEPGPDQLYLHSSSESLPYAKKESEETAEMFDPFILDDKGALVYCRDIPKVLASRSTKRDQAVCLKIDGDNWSLFGDTCYIEAKNISKSDIVMSITVKEVRELDLLDEDTKTKFNMYAKLFADVNGAGISHSERKKKHLSAPEFIYGEVEFPHIFPIILAAVGPRAGGIFWDLGCGAGKAMVIAALTGQFSAVCGMELLTGLVAATRQVGESYEKAEGLPKTKFVVQEGDIGKVDWSNADVVYASSVYYPDSLMKTISEKASLLKKGARIVTLKMMPTSADLKVVYHLRVKMSWGLNALYMLERVQSQ